VTRITQISFTLLLAALVVAAGPACSLVPAGRAPVLVYTVNSASDGFEVRLDAEDLPGRHPAFRILDSWGALADMPGHIENIRAVDATGAEIGLTQAGEDGETRWKLERNPGRFTLSYRVRGYEPAVSPEASFVADARFVWIGYSVLLTPVNLSARAPASLSIHVRAPEGWEAWGSWPREDGVYRPANAHDAWSGFAAAGDFKSSHLSSDLAGVTVLTEGTASAGLGLHIANRLLPVLREMVALFGVSPRGDRLDVLALYRGLRSDGRRSVVSGTSQESAFLCMATPDRFNDLDGLTALAAHECFHLYIGGAVIASPEPPFQNAPDLIWLMEGITEYMAFRLMERSGGLTPAGFADVARRKEAEWLSTPGHRDLTLADAARAMGDLRAYALVYSRGFLVARLIDEQMEAISGPGAMDRALRRLFEEHNRYEGAGLLSEAQAMSAFERESPGIRSTIERYAVGREPLPTLERSTP
jgi:predicted metalloprotease with PDZ domain